jgi:hypothetical protein
MIISQSSSHNVYVIVTCHIQWRNITSFISFHNQAIKFSQCNCYMSYSIEKHNFHSSPFIIKFSHCLCKKSKFSQYLCNCHMSYSMEKQNYMHLLSQPSSFSECLCNCYMSYSMLKHNCIILYKRTLAMFM